MLKCTQCDFTMKVITGTHDDLNCPNCLVPSMKYIPEPSSPIYLNTLRDMIFENTCKKGFHDDFIHYPHKRDFHRELNIIIGELMEAFEADRNGRWIFDLHNLQNKSGLHIPQALLELSPMNLERWYNENLADTAEMEIIDTLIKLFDFCGLYDIDIDRLLPIKMKINRHRPGLRGRRY